MEYMHASRNGVSSVTFSQTGFKRKTPLSRFNMHTPPPPPPPQKKKQQLGYNISHKQPNIYYTLAAYTLMSCT